MIIDNEAIVGSTPDVATNAFDTEVFNPSKGEPINMALVNDSVITGTFVGEVASGTLTISDGATEAAAIGGLNTVFTTVKGLPGTVLEFRLPSSCERYICIQALPANGAVVVQLEGVQTAR